jgi:hypothetical protein
MRLTEAITPEDKVFFMKFVKHKKNRRLLAVWSLDCAEHILPLFEKKHLKDKRPRQAIEAGRAWVRGEIRVGEVRKAALATHAAARAVEEPARSAARAAGHAAATAHVITHCVGAPMYACKALSFLRTQDSKKDPITAERRWQMARLKKMLDDKII